MFFLNDRKKKAEKWNMIWSSVMHDQGKLFGNKKLSDAR